MRDLALIAGILFLTAGGSFLFRVRGAAAFSEWTGRGATTIRLIWALYLAICAWLVDNGTNDAWGSPVAICAPSAESGWFFLMLSAGRGAETIFPALCIGSGDLRGLRGSMLTLPFPVVLPTLLVALWLGSIAGWWRSLGVLTAWQVAKHSARGVLWTGPAAMVLSFGLGSPWPLLIVGVLCGPIYYLCRVRWPFYAVESGEWIFGAGIAAALLFSVAFS